MASLQKLILIVCFVDLIEWFNCNQQCPQISDRQNLKNECSLFTSHQVNGKDSKWKDKKYILYEVDVLEGFNLQRSVYIKMALILKQLNHNWVLVLPPWGLVQHWNSTKSMANSKLPWSYFFDLPSLNKFVEVIEFEDYLKIFGPNIDIVLGFDHFHDTFENQFVERYNLHSCSSHKSYYLDENNMIRGWFSSYEHVSAKTLICVNFEGFPSTTKRLIENHFNSTSSLMIINPEVVLFEHYGDYHYWSARRSMRFASNLIKIGDHFRKHHLDSTDENDQTELEPNWRLMKRNKGLALGGPYLAVHLRRRDFVTLRSNLIPTIECASKQIITLANKYFLKKVFIASDADEKEWTTLFNLIQPLGLEVFRFKDNNFLDGQVAIIDQWICAHAQLFIGTSESTFSMRIQEEREILGFNASTTFLALASNCSSIRNDDIVKQTTRWQIVYEDMDEVVKIKQNSNVDDQDEYFINHS